MISGVIWSSMKAMRSRNCSLRFFSRCSRSKIRRRRLVQRVDRRIEIAMLLLQPGKLVFELALIFVGHGVR